MRNPKFSTDALRSFFYENTIGTMPQLKDALGTSVEMTIYRKLRQLSSLTSYSHRGKYYTLRELAQFDSLGLWQFDVVRFSTYGNLLSTVQILIEKSDKGYSLAELRSRLGVEVKETLWQLQQQHRAYREEIAGRYVYFSIDAKRRTQQQLLRLEETGPLKTSQGHLLAHEVRAAIILFFSLLDERQRRLYAGLESLRLGHGGDQMISSLLQIDNHTVARGRRELIQRDIALDRIRKKGGGRLPIKKNPADH
jgi:hypothetical protein